MNIYFIKSFYHILFYLILSITLQGNHFKYKKTETYREQMNISISQYKWKI